MGKDKKQERLKDEDMTVLLSRLHVTQHNSIKHRYGVPQLPRRSLPQNSVPMRSTLVALGPGSDQQIDYPAVLQVSKLLRLSSIIGEQDCILMEDCIALLNTCGLSAAQHYDFLRQWQSSTSLMLSSPVFQDPSFWRDTILAHSTSSTALHCALLAVSGLHLVRINRRLIETSVNVQAAYRLRAESERRLRFNNNESEHVVTVATHCCLLLFDYLTGNEEALSSRLLQTKIAMRAAKFWSYDSAGRFFFWSVARLDRISSHLRTKNSVLDVDDLMWSRPIGNESMELAPHHISNKIGMLYAGLLTILSDVAKLTFHSDESAFIDIDARLIRWREDFPLELQTYPYDGDMHDPSCFLHALTCSGGPRAIALHCLYAEVMILRLRASPEDHGKSEIHEHAMTICKLTQSLTSSIRILQDSISADLSHVLCSLLVAGQHLFSKDGKNWMSRLLRWITEISGNQRAEQIADYLETCWRETRTRPRPIQLEDDPETMRTNQVIGTLADFRMNEVRQDL